MTRNCQVLLIMMLSFITGAFAQKTTDTLTVVVAKRVYHFENTPSWTDEFDYKGLPDHTKWSFDTGGNGWGNHELEYYTANLTNARVANGKLYITARKDTMGGRNYTSARLTTRGKADFLYGRFEIRAKLPEGKGTWPAIWMLPTDKAYGNWPKSGEIDIMEHVGYDPGKVHVSTHSEAYYFKIKTQKTAIRQVDDIYSKFHVYRLDWTPGDIKCYIDNELVFSFADEGTGYKVWPFDKRFHILLNLAIGGDWGGAKGVDDGIFPATMVIDYVRAYKMLD